MTEERDAVRAVLPSALEALVSGGVQLLGSDPVTAAAAGIVIGAGYLIDRARQQRLGQANAAFSTAQEAMADQDAVATALSSQSRLELTVRVLEAASRAMMKDKIEALGKVLAQGLQAATVDEALFITAALADIEAPHVQVLSLVEPPVSGGTGLTSDDAVASLPGHTLVMDPIIEVLRHRGLIRNGAEGTYGGSPPRYVRTSIGSRCLELLEDAAGT
jgi:hypothetical protein